MHVCPFVCYVAPFSVEKRALINELRLDDIGVHRRADILEQTFNARRRWVVNCLAKYSDFVLKCLPLKGVGVQVVHKKDYAYFLVSFRGSYFLLWHTMMI